MMAKEKDEEKTVDCGVKWHKNSHGAMGGGGFYCVGMVGAAVYFIGQVSGFWPIVLAILKAFVWPAFFVYYGLQALIK